MRLDPKKRFIESGDAKAWADLAASEWFHRGLECALAEFTMKTGLSPDMPTAAAIAARAEGARSFISIMLNLTNPEKEPVAPVSTPRNLPSQLLSAQPKK